MLVGILELLIILGIIVVFFVAILALAGRGGGRGDRESREAEARMIAEMHAGIERLSERVEALETLMLDRERRHKE